MAVKRTTAVLGSDLVRYHATEDGVGYRGHRQDLNPVLDHVKYMNEKVNHAPKVGNRNDWRYGGSIPKIFLQEWLTLTGYRMDQFAREKIIRKEFITWMQDRDRRNFIADDGQLKVMHA